MNGRMKLKKVMQLKKTPELADFSAKLLTTEEFKYYYVDTRTRWFEISATNDRTSPEIGPNY